MFVIKVFAEWGGLERVWSDKMNALCKAGYDIYLVTTDQGNHTFPYSLNEGIHHIDLGIRFTQIYAFKGLVRIWKTISLIFSFKKQLQVFLEEIHPDILVSNTSFFVDVLVRLKGEIPLIVESHGICERPFHMEKMNVKNHFKKFFHYHAIGKADVVVALTKQDASQWKKINSYVCTIPDMVHLNLSSTFSTNESKRIIFVGRLDSQKGYDQLSKIWDVVSLKHPDWSLDIYGEGVDQEKNRNLIPQGKNVFVHSHTSQILEKYKECSILILTSVYEPFGLVIPEAMSCGLPVVSFDCPYGPSEIISHGVDGFLVRQGDTSEFADKLFLLMENAELRKTMGLNAIQSSQKYAVDKILPKWQQLYNKIVSKTV